MNLKIPLHQQPPDRLRKVWKSYPLCTAPKVPSVTSGENLLCTLYNNFFCTCLLQVNQIHGLKKPNHFYDGGTKKYSRGKDKLYNSYWKPPIVFFCLKHSWTIKVSQDLNMAPAMIFLQYLLYNIWCVWKENSSGFALNWFWFAV